jgi:hypothetical protein
LSTSKACAVMLCDRRTRNHARAVRLFGCTSPADCDGHRWLTR